MIKSVMGYAIPPATLGSIAKTRFFVTGSATVFGARLGNALNMFLRIRSAMVRRTVLIPLMSLTVMQKPICHPARVP